MVRSVHRNSPAGNRSDPRSKRCLADFPGRFVVLRDHGCAVDRLWRFAVPKAPQWRGGVCRRLAGHVDLGNLGSDPGRLGACFGLVGAGASGICPDGDAGPCVDCLARVASTQDERGDCGCGNGRTGSVPCDGGAVPLHAQQDTSQGATETQDVAQQAEVPEDATIATARPAQVTPWKQVRIGRSTVAPFMASGIRL